MYPASCNSVKCFLSSFNSSIDILDVYLQIGAVPGIRSMTNSTSLSGGIPGNSSGKTSKKIFLTAHMLPPTNFSSTKNVASLMVVVTAIATSYLSFGTGEFYGSLSIVYILPLPFLTMTYQVSRL
jgi:hypothetical protein